jgi:hypothetical protein
VGKYPTLLFFCGGEEEVVVEYRNEMKDVKVLKEWAEALKDQKVCAEWAKKTKRSPPREKPVIDLEQDFGAMRVAM